VRAPGIKKKRKCPVCGKYLIKLKSELNEGEISERAGSGAAPPVAGGDGSVSPSPSESASTPAVSGTPEDKAEEKEEKTSGGGLLLLVVGLVVVGIAACIFLFRRSSSLSGSWGAAATANGGDTIPVLAGV